MSNWLPYYETGAAAGPVQHKRHWWLALPLSVLAPGLGHVYVGAWRRGLLFMGLMLTVYVGAVVAIPHAFWALVAFFVVGPQLWLGIHADALRLCRPQSADLRWFQRWYWCVAMAVTLAGASVLIHTGVRAVWGFPASYYSASGSMLPTLSTTDYLQVWLHDKPERWMQRGDLILYRTRPGGDFIKRVVGVPGERVTIRAGLPMVDGVSIRYTPLRADDPAARRCRAPWVGYGATMQGGRSYAVCARPIGELENRSYTVPEGFVFVLDDNLGYSADSRRNTSGMVKFADIKGRVQYIYWSADLSRIGLSLTER